MIYGLPIWAFLMLVITILGALVSLVTKKSNAFGDAITLDILIGIAIFLLRVWGK
jgi:hypothetical protein